MNDEIIRRLLTEVEELKREQKRLASLMPLYSIFSSRVAATLTANQDNYAPGDVDFLYMASDASRNISGFTGGAAGRRLWMHNFGAQNIVLLHNSVLSSVGNRISCHTAANITIAPRKAAVMVYASPFWTVLMNS